MRVDLAHRVAHGGLLPACRQGGEGKDDEGMEAHVSQATGR
jgi:hypothetical protein